MGNTLCENTGENENKKNHLKFLYELFELMLEG